MSDPVHGRNRSAVDATIEALRMAGRIDPVDSARVVLAQALADAVDADPLNASLWREYRAAEAALRETSDAGVDEFVNLVQSLSAEVGNKPKP